MLLLSKILLNLAALSFVCATFATLSIMFGTKWEESSSEFLVKFSKWLDLYMPVFGFVSIVFLMLVGVAGVVLALGVLF